MNYFHPVLDYHFLKFNEQIYIVTYISPYENRPTFNVVQNLSHFLPKVAILKANSYRHNKNDIFVHITFEFAILV